MKKKFISVLIICLVLFSLPVMASTTEMSNQSEEVYTQIIPKEVREADIERQINSRLEQLNNNEKSRIGPMSRAVYSSEKISTKYKTFSGYPGGQLPGGEKFGTGGGFWWVNSGGPSLSGSITFSVPYKLVDVGVSLGIASTSNIGGRFVTVPNTTNYFKVYISKTMQVQQVNFYRQNTPSSPKVLYDISYYNTLYSQSQSVRAVR